MRLNNRNKKRTNHVTNISKEEQRFIYTVPSETEQFIAKQSFFGRNLELSSIKGKIRFLNVYTEWNGVPLQTWVSNTLYSSDKSLVEWRNIIQNYKQSACTFQFIQDGVSILEALVMKHLQLRSRVRKFIRNVRMQVSARRVIGEVDLYTTTVIPQSSQIRVFDFSSKSVYVFHTQTAVRIILSALKHSLYGIPTPQMPKNPYTNLPFHYTQLMTIMEQICVNCARAHHTPPLRLFQFRKCCYDVEIFKTVYRHNLNMDSARTLLHSFHDSDSIIYYMEVLDDTIEVEDLASPHWDIIRTYVRNRTLPLEILKRFDAVVLCLFLFHNHSLCYTFKSYEAMLVEVEIVYKAALLWWKHMPRKITKRAGEGPGPGPGPVPAVGAPPSNSQILEHV